MALKDWKKIGKDEWKNIPKSKNSSLNYVIRIKQKEKGVPVSILSSKTISMYRVQVGYYATLYNNEFTEDRAEYFKTKSQALKFAKAYMRKH